MTGREEETQTVATSDGGFSFFFSFHSRVAEPLSESEGESAARDGKITQLLLGDSSRAVR